MENEEVSESGPEEMSMQCPKCAAPLKVKLEAAQEASEQTPDAAQGPKSWMMGGK